MNNTLKGEEGIISIVATFTLIFLLIFSVSIYTYINSSKSIVQDQTYDYDTLFNNNPNIVFAKNTEIIPINNADEFSIVGTGANLKKNNVIYQFGIGMSYVLRDNIIIDIDEEVKESKYDFLDFKLYSTNYHIDTNGNNIYYYKDGLLYKLLVYQKFNDDSLQNNIITDINKKEKDNFTRFDLIDKTNDDVNLILLWKDKESLKYNEFTETMKSNKLSSINSIKMLNSEKENIIKNALDYYVFISIGNSI